MKKIISSISLALLITVSQQLVSQTEGVSIKTTPSAPHPSAMLDIESGSKGLLIPRVVLTSTAVAAPVSSPTTGLLIYNTTTSVTAGFYYWDQSLLSGAGAWVKLTTGPGGLWTQDHTTGNTNNIYRKSGIVTVGAPTSGAGGTYAGSTASLNVFGRALFYSDNNSGSSTLPNGSDGIAIGEPFNGVGGHWNEINVHGYSHLDINYGNGYDVHVGGGGGGSEFTVHKNSTGGKGHITAEGDIWSQGHKVWSDSTLKKDISALSDVSSKLIDLKTYEYRFKDQSSEAPLRIGIMAQEIEVQFPQLVTAITRTTVVGNKFATTPETVSKTIKSVDYNGLTAVLLKALKEQMAIIEDLKNRVQYLETH